MTTEERALVLAALDRLEAKLAHLHATLVAANEAEGATA